MKKSNVLDHQAARLILLVMCAAALVAAFVVALPQPAQANNLTPPQIPANLMVQAGNRMFLEGHAVGTQDYICLPSGTGFAWTFLRPQATLFDGNQEQITTHFLSPNPSEGGTARATWQDSQDTSAVWAVAIESSTDPKFVAPGAIPWLKLEVVNSQDGPTGGGNLTGTTYIQRLNTTGGIAPTTGCSLAGDVGKRAFVPYTADYVFYRK